MWQHCFNLSLVTLNCPESSRVFLNLCIILFYHKKFNINKTFVFEIKFGYKFHVVKYKTTVTKKRFEEN